jgi:hypothetical protein
MSREDVHENWRAPEQLSIFCRTIFDVGHYMLILSFMSRAQSNDDGAFVPSSRPRGRPVGDKTVEDAVRCVSLSCHTTAAKLTWWNGKLSNKNRVVSTC